MPLSRHFVIQGVTNSGRQFRPSDWAERLCSVLASFGADERLRYAEDVRPMLIEGRICVAFSPVLARRNPQGYRFLMDFARENDLRLIEPATEEAA